MVCWDLWWWILLAFEVGDLVWACGGWGDVAMVVMDIEVVGMICERGWL